MSLHELLEIHKETVLFSGNGFDVDCILKKKSTDEGYPLTGYTSFIGVSFDENNVGCFSDSFELTISTNALKKLTDDVPKRGWFVSVKFKSDFVDFKIENIATDRTVGMYLIKCSAITSTGNPKSVVRQYNGGM